MCEQSQPRYWLIPALFMCWELPLLDVVQTDAADPSWQQREVELLAEPHLFHTIHCVEYYTIAGGACVGDCVMLVL